MKSPIEEAISYVRLKIKGVEEFPFESSMVMLLARESIEEDKRE
ncbi:MAG: hypothetical protein QXV69_06290 [Sulfolobaceae archaeon]